MMAAVARAVAGDGAGLADVSDTLSLLLQLHKLIGWDGRHGGGGGGGGRVRRRSGWRSWLRPVQCTRVWRGPGCGRHTVGDAIAEIAGRAVVSQKRCSSNGSLGLGRPSEKVECAPPKTCRRHIQTFCVAAGCVTLDRSVRRPGSNCRCIAGGTQPDLTRPCACPR